MHHHHQQLEPLGTCRPNLPYPPYSCTMRDAKGHKLRQPMSIKRNFVHFPLPCSRPQPQHLKLVSQRSHLLQVKQMARHLSLGRRHRLDIKHSTQQVLDHLVLALATGLLDLLDLDLGLLVCLLLGLLVSLRVLIGGVHRVSISHINSKGRPGDGSPWLLRFFSAGGRVGGGLWPYLSLKLLESLLLSRPVLLYLLLGLITSLLDTLRSDCFHTQVQEVRFRIRVYRAEGPMDG